MTARRPHTARLRVLAPAALALAAWMLASSLALATPLGDQERARVEALIEQLGDESYARRMEAQQRLRLYGVEVLDALRQADDHPDPQVARTAGYLLRSSNVVWSSDGDSPRVRKLLRSYESDNLSERATKIEQLANLPDDEGIAALARVARYEFSGDLARRAALELLQMGQNGRDAAQLRRRWQGVLDTIQDSQTRPCQWLRQSAQMHLDAPEAPPGGQDPAALADGLTLPEVPPGSGFRMPPSGLIDAYSRSLALRPESFDDAWWAAQIDAEQELLESSPGETSSYVLEELCRYRAQTLVWCGRRADALRAAPRLIDLLQPEGDSEVYALAKWAIDYGMPELALEVLRPRLEDPLLHSLLRYMVAEANLWLGEDETAKRLAAAELKSNQNVRSSAKEELVKGLAVRGLHEWAEAECQAGIENEASWDYYTIELILVYYQLLQDDGNHAAVDELLERVTEELENLAALRQELNTYRPSITIPYLRSVQLHSKGKVQAAAGQVKEAQASWREAIALSPENVDIAIDMHRLPGNEAWRREVAETIERVTATSWQDVQDKEAAMQTPNPSSSNPQEDYANALNTHAWLLANVDGDKRLALRLSLQSNRLAPDHAAYYDTLARCYYSLEDLETAAHWQLRAWKLAPHQRQLLATWLEYRKELGKASP